MLKKRNYIKQDGIEEIQLIPNLINGQKQPMFTAWLPYGSISQNCVKHIGVKTITIHSTKNNLRSTILKDLQ